MDRGGVRKEGGKEQGERRDKGVTGTQRRADCAECFPEAVQDGN